MELTERDRQVAVWYSLGRAGFGAVAMAAPGMARVWIGPDEARRPLMKMIVRAFGARDLALGVGSYLALSDEKSDAAKTWLQLSAVSDATDAVATLLAARHLSKRRVATALTAAVTGAVTGFRLTSR